MNAQIKLTFHSEVTGKFITGSGVLILKDANGSVVVIPKDWLTSATKERAAFPQLSASPSPDAEKQS